MRVIAGTYRRLPLKTLKGRALRPTSGEVRETLFNVLGEPVRESRFLDVYAGSGAVGIEALSRGASRAVFVENHRPAVLLIRENLRALGIGYAAEIVARPATTAIDRLEREGAEFDFVFLDPPYSEIREYHRTLRTFGRSRLLHPASLVIAEHSRQCHLETNYSALSLTRLIRHGDSQLAFYRRAAAGPVILL